MFAANDIGQGLARSGLNPLLNRPQQRLFLVKLFPEARNEMGGETLPIAIEFKHDSFKLSRATFGGVQ